MSGDAFAGMEYLPGCLGVFAAVTVPLSIWKVIDILLWIFG